MQAIKQTLAWAGLLHGRRFRLQSHFPPSLPNTQLSVEHSASGDQIIRAVTNLQVRHATPDPNCGCPFPSPRGQVFEVESDVFVVRCSAEGSANSQSQLCCWI